MTTAWLPYREPLRSTLTRTVAIALVIGGIFARLTAVRWPMATLLMLWPAFGGHWVELWYLNWLRPRVPEEPRIQVVARLGTWFVAGIVIALGMAFTVRVIVGVWPSRWPAWWVAGLAFIGVELIAHLALHMRRRPSFYNGRG